VRFPWPGPDLDRPVVVRRHGPPAAQSPDDLILERPAPMIMNKAILHGEG